MRGDPAEVAKIVTVGEGFYVRQAVDNIAWIDLGEYAIVVDALEQPQLEGEIFEAIRSTLGDKPVRYLLNTHAHGDHTALNPAFERSGAEIVNQRTTPMGPDGRWFEGTQRRLLMLPLTGSHTREDCVVWAPDDKALFTGDIFGWGLIPVGNLRSETAELLLSIYARMIEFDASVVIPGHGPLCTTEELRRWVEYFGWLRERIVRACAEDESDRRIRKALSAPEDMKTWWRFELWKHEDSVEKVLRAVRSGQLGE